MPKSVVNYFFAFIIFVYLFGALLNIGKLSFNYSEAKNAIISLQMNLSSNYKWQTILGKPYFKKPPLNAYILSFAYKVCGEKESTARLLSLFFLFLISTSLFILRVDKKIALKFSLIFLTSITMIYSTCVYSTKAIFVFFLFLALYQVYFKGKHFALWLILSFMSGGLVALFLFYVVLISLAVWENQNYLINTKEHLWALTAVVILSLLGVALYQFDIKTIHYLVGSLFLNFFEEFNFKSYIEHLIFYPFNVGFIFLPYSLFIKNVFKRQSSVMFSFAFKIFFVLFILMWVLPFSNHVILWLFFALLISQAPLNLSDIYLKSIIAISLLIFVFLDLFGFLFVKQSNYFLAFLITITSISLIYVIKKHKIEHIWCIVLLGACLKFSYNAVVIPYEYSYLPKMKTYGQSIGNIILKHKAKYVMSNNVHLDLLYYVEESIKQPIYKPKRNAGVLVGQDFKKFKKIYGSEFSPYGVYYIGEY